MFLLVTDRHADDATDVYVDPIILVSVLLSKNSRHFLCRTQSISVTNC